MDNRFICGGRLLKRLASEAGLVFTVEAAEPGRRDLVACDDALESNVLGPVIALQTERVWQALFPHHRGLPTGATFLVQQESMVGLAVQWPLLGRDVVSIHRMLAITRAANTLLDLDQQQVVEVETICDWYRAQDVRLQDNTLFVPAGEGWPAVRIPLIFIEGERHAPQETVHA